MKIEVEVQSNGHITLKRNGELIIVSHSSARIGDIVVDMLDNNGESPLLNTKPGPLSLLFDL